MPSRVSPQVPADGYGEHDLRRRVREEPKDSRRRPFARDRARIVHSSALRRLAAKTQVVGPETDDFVRNRLTHSLEVAQVGRELGQALGCDPDVVDTACLAHDLGHPPFGHNGEDQLDALAADIGGFEGNAQTLRVLTRLEPKVFDPATGEGAGLNLTRASLDACTKYPWPRGGGPERIRRQAPGKFGVYPDDVAVFAWLREGVDVSRPGRRCLEAQVMDLADDVAYSVHDVEDAVVGRHLHPGLLADPGVLDQVGERTREWYLPDAGTGEVAEALARLRALPVWVGDYDGSRRSLAALKDLTSSLIGRFVRAVEAATRQQYGPGVLTRYAADLVVPREVAVEVAALKGVAAVFVMTAAARQPLYRAQREMLAELFDALLAGAPQTLDPDFAADWRRASAVGAGGDALRRIVVDQLASLTDARAVARHAQLVRGGRVTRPVG